MTQSDEKVNILVVDDLEEKLLVYETILEGLGQNVVTARSGREALRQLLEQEFAVILLDVSMPDMDGLETAAMIRSRRQTAHTPIIFITAFSDEMHTAQGYSLGAVDYILTPVVPEILRTKVGVFVDLYKKTQQVKKQAEEHVALARAQAARAAAEEARRRSAFLAEASTILVRSLDYEAIPRGLARQVVPFLGDVCVVTLNIENEPDRWCSELAWTSGSERTGPGAMTSIQSATLTGDRELGVIAALIRKVRDEGRGELFADFAPVTPDRAGPDARVRAGERRVGEVDRVVPLAGLEPAAALAIPLFARGRTLGVIAIALRDSGRRYGPEDLELATDLADRAAIAIDNARLYRDLQENNRRKNEFLAMLAHELRNPLAPIRNAVEILRVHQHPRADPQVGQRRHHAPGRAARPPGRRSPRHLADQRRQDPAPHGAGGRRGGGGTRGRDQPAADRRPTPLAERRAAPASVARQGRHGPARSGTGKPPQQRGEVHRRRRPDRAGGLARSPTRRSSASETMGSESRRRWSPASSTCSPRLTGRSTGPRAVWESD